ncbi:nucleoside triphosphate pyrophosphohydrolase [Akkermansia glycaniphila]|uniref:nucleoside triphosphate pyrophosphohydrolase n=1 Tax=Akkermansia glycaniphila TaxID=1679444 RepID=UPI001C037FC3|nr:nucleoside triphosphate pyrophosphohydrolase [Akkermansia glycaniphila]MBT9448904.1 nucleoside triphosphate pyrophosphohydrolase [Akkermansia glycaniphila]
MNDHEMTTCTEPSRQIERARAIMHRLRAPGGCPWDAEQTHQSLIPNMIEESYELVDAIQRSDWNHMREELGDVLMQVLFHTEIAGEHAGYGLDEVAAELCEKLIRRHPHVFEQVHDMEADAVLMQWDRIKRKEKSIEDKPYLHGTGKGLPALMRAAKLQKKASKIGFDWDNVPDVAAKIHEELGECEETFSLPDEDPRVEEELGDLLFSVVNLCRKRRIDPEVALAQANMKFERRFAAMETSLKQAGHTLAEASLDTMETAWQQAKQSE